MSEQFENMLHSLCFAYADEKSPIDAQEKRYDEAYAKLVERDRKLIEALREAVEWLEVHDHYPAAQRLESVLKELGEDV
jgi:hypothetical protein